VSDTSAGWTFPLILAGTVVVIVWIVMSTLTIADAALGDPLAGRFMWAVTAVLFATVFVFAIVQCHILMFRCGEPADAFIASVVVTMLGFIATLVLGWNSDWYLGPSPMKRLLEATAFSAPGVRTLTGVFDGLAGWAALAILATSCTILRNDTGTAEELSRQMRGARILLNVGSALLITGVAEVSALHTWPAHELSRVASCCSDLLKSATDAGAIEAFKDSLDTSTTAIATLTGTACSLVLAAAYLPLGVLLRQRAYRVIKPWERTEAWLVMHGMSLQPMQQLGKVLLMLGPIIAGGPAAALIRFLAQ
jgi:hypothetical protein